MLVFRIADHDRETRKSERAHSNVQGSPEVSRRGHHLAPEAACGHYRLSVKRICASAVAPLTSGRLLVGCRGRGRRGSLRLRTRRADGLDGIQCRAGELC